jgi:hypothetical protein
MLQRLKQEPNWHQFNVVSFTVYEQQNWKLFK